MALVVGLEPQLFLRPPVLTEVAVRSVRRS